MIKLISTDLKWGIQNDFLVSVQPMHFLVVWCLTGTQLARPTARSSGFVFFLCWKEFTLRKFVRWVKMRKAFSILTPFRESEVQLDTSSCRLAFFCLWPQNLLLWGSCYKVNYICQNSEPEDEIKFVALSTSNILFPSGYHQNKVKSKMGKSVCFAFS